MAIKFSYTDMTSRNYGFIDQTDQQKLKTIRVFIPGVGGMGGVALENLVRMGVENFIIADQDEFELSNINRQVVSDLSTVGVSKTVAAVKRMQLINPQVQIKTYDFNWIKNLKEILNQVDIVINGCDDTKSTILLMRTAKTFNKIVIDAFASPFPNVYVVKPTDPRPEKTFGFPTVEKDFDLITDDDIKKCGFNEFKYVIFHSSSIDYVVKEPLVEYIQGRRKRFSLCPMVWMTGCLMSYELLKFVQNKQDLMISNQGVFYNIWEQKTEKAAAYKFNIIHKFKTILKLKKMGVL